MDKVEQVKSVRAWAAINGLNIIFPHLVFIAKERAEEVVVLRSHSENTWRVIPVTISPEAE